MSDATRQTAPAVEAAPPPLKLDAETIQHAIRDAARPSAFGERAAMDLRDPTRSAFDGHLGTRIERAARGDCLRGEFKGSKMGLLSLPMLALAAARNECAG
ncbi:MAG TPA: hypothetical protein VGI11_14375 [Variovorax sp.]|jgi:hypothetical protein